VGEPIAEDPLGLADIHASLEVLRVSKAGSNDHHVVAIHQAILDQ